jgi:YbbR domain-containing protein
MFRIFTNNCVLKLLSVLIALILFNYVYSNLNIPVTQVYNWPIEVRGVRSDLAFAGLEGDAERVRVRVTGPPRSMRQLALRRVSAYIDCRNVSKPGTVTLRITAPDLGDLQVTELQPSSADVHIEERMTRKMEIKAENHAVAATGFVIAAEDVSPSEVSISGPRGEIERLAQAVVRFESDPLSGDVTSALPVTLLGDSGTVEMARLNVVPDHVRFSLRVRSEQGVRVLKLVPQFSGALGDDYLLRRTDVDPRFVVVDPELVPSSLHYIQLPPIDLAGVAKGFKRKVAVEYPFKLPAGSKLPLDATVEVEVLPFDSQATLRLPVQPRGLRAGYTCRLEPPQVVIRSAGLRELPARQRTEITAVLDLSSLEAGDYSLAPQLRLPSNLGDLKVDPPTVQVTIIAAGSQAP